MSGKAGLGFSAASCHLEVLINRTQRDRVHFMAPYNVLVLVLVTTCLSIGSESIAQNNISYPILCPNIWLACILLFDVKVKIFLCQILLCSDPNIPPTNTRYLCLINMRDIIFDIENTDYRPTSRIIRSFVRLETRKANHHWGQFSEFEERTLSESSNLSSIFLLYKTLRL